MTPNKESVSGHGCGRSNLAAKCEIFRNCNKNFIGICKKKRKKKDKRQK